MPSNRARSRESLNRRNPIRQAKKRFLIVCEGGTEQNYFSYLKGREGLNLDTTNKEFIITVEKHGGPAKGVVKEACEIKKKQKLDIDNDIIWAVFDTENLLKNKNEENLFEAISEAKANKIEMAISCPCIEYWLLLHYKNIDPAFSECKPVVKDLKTIIPSYEKYQEPSYYAKHFPLDKIRAAVVHARRFYERVPDDKKYEQTCTDIYKLIAKLFEMANIELSLPLET